MVSFVIEILSTQVNADAVAGELKGDGFNVTGPDQYDSGSVSYEQNGNLTTSIVHNFGAAWVVYGCK